MVTTANRAPELKTSRLTLRAPDLSDADALVAIFQDWEMVKNLSRVPWPYRRADAVAYIEGRQSKSDELAFLLDDGFVVGSIGLRNINKGKAALGYWIAQRAWGQGYASEAIRRIVQFGFEDLDLHTMEAEIITNNHASIRVIEKSGFQHVGRSNCATRCRGDVPSMIYRLNADTWRLA